MIKKLSVLALAGCFALPSLAGAASNADLASKIDQLSQELAELRGQMDEQEYAFEEIDERADGWDLASRFQFSGDFRARGDMYSADLSGTPADMNQWFENAVFSADSLQPTDRDMLMVNLISSFAGAQAGLDTGAPVYYIPNSYDQYTSTFAMPFQNDDELTNDTIFTNRFRLNMRVKATENVEFKARLAMYKVWGTGNAPDNLSVLGFPAFDGTSTRTPSDSTLRVDRAFMNWNNIAGQPVWFSIGRRPTTDGPSAHIRQGLDKRTATPSAYMDWPFDGISAGYAYANLFGIQDAPGRVRVCYGRGFENGLQYDADSASLNDTDFAGVSWDILKKGDRFAYIQSFMVFNAFNYPEFDDANTNSFYNFFLGDRANVGDILHTSATYQDKFAGLNVFANAGWSRTMPDEEGMFNDFAGQMAANMNNMLGQPPVAVPANNTDSENGYSVWIGARYDLDDLGLKFGAEYNHGSEYWIAMTPGHDEMYASKLATRGDAYEAYVIWDLPSGEAVSKFGKAFMRLGYQHYEYDYSGGSDWNIKPYEIGVDDGMWAQMMPTVESADQVYLTMEAYF
ncbi:MAG: DUF3373 family protein [Desulfobulbaceae bacterium]|nr:DUF3373 family protein [Desulfobulbaceae bacterium]